MKKLKKNKNILNKFKEIFHLNRFEAIDIVI